MPTYDYLCENCGYGFEQFQSITAKPLVKCPECAKRSLKRLIGSGAGIIFKGSGFYQTDYRSADYGAAANKEKTASDSGPAKSESKKKDDSKSKKSSKPATKSA